MAKNYIHIYNTLIKLTRNKLLYKKIETEETFSIRLIIFLIHFAFFLKIFKKNNTKEKMQDIYDFNFRQIEISIREIGYGDVSINKKMKDYLNLFHKIIEKIDKWEKIELSEKSSFFKEFLSDNCDVSFFVDYFNKYTVLLEKNTLNSFTNNILDL